MIDLKLADYCSTCPDLEVVQDTNILNDKAGEIVRVKHFLTCANAKKCERLIKYLKNRV